MRIASLFLLLSVLNVRAQVTHYALKLTPDLDHNLLHGEETIEFHHDKGNVEWQKQPSLQISSMSSADGEAAVKEDIVSIRLHTRGKHVLHFKYTAAQVAASSGSQTKLEWILRFIAKRGWCVTTRRRREPPLLWKFFFPYRAI